MDLMSKGMAWLERTRRRCCSVPVVYERVDPQGGTSRFIPVPAVLGLAGASAEDSVQPIRIDSADMDFLVAASDLLLDGLVVEPRVDDRIRMEAGGRTRIYEVLPRTNDPRIRDGKTPWRWSDPQQTILRIHARLSDVQPASGGRVRARRAGHRGKTGL